MRGGGAGPWGAVTSVTFKLHKPRCTKQCYFVENCIWQGKYSEDDGKMAADLVAKFMHWVSTTASDYWSGYVLVAADPTPDVYNVAFADMMFVGDKSDPDKKSLGDFFRDAYPDKVVYYGNQTYDTYFEKTLTQFPEPVGVKSPQMDWTSVLLNGTVIAESSEDIANDIINTWVPRCYRSPFFSQDCGYMFQMHMTLPRQGKLIPGKD